MISSIVIHRNYTFGKNRNKSHKFINVSECTVNNIAFSALKLHFQHIYSHHSPEVPLFYDLEFCIEHLIGVQESPSTE